VHYRPGSKNWEWKHRLLQPKDRSGALANWLPKHLLEAHQSTAACHATRTGLWNLELGLLGQAVQCPKVGLRWLINLSQCKLTRTLLQKRDGSSVVSLNDKEQDRILSSKIMHGPS
jgi:hypothetical protein